MKYRLFNLGLAIAISVLVTDCTFTPRVPNDKTGPVIGHIETSSKGFSIDCVPTSITVTASITNPSEVTHALLWYRVQTDQPYLAANMELIKEQNRFSATVQALDLPVGEYGTWEFYISAEDKFGNQSQSRLDTSVQLLPCVS